MSSGERDKQFDEVLGRHVQRHLRDDARENCPDANVLAAYHERSLSPEEMSAWKEHIASCAACQEVLTQLEETDDILVAEPSFAREKEQVFAAAETDRVAMAAAPVQEYAAAQPESPKLRAVSEPVSITARKEAGIAKLPASKKIFRWVAPAGAIAAGLLIYAVVHENRMPKTSSSAPIEVAENRKEAAASPQQAPLDLERANLESKTQTGDQVGSRRSADEKVAARQDQLLEENKTLQMQKGQAPAGYSDFAKLAPAVVPPAAPKLLRQQKNEAQRMSGAAAGAPAFTDSKIAPPPPPAAAGNVQAQAPPLPSLAAPVSADSPPAPAEKDAFSAGKESKKDSPLIGATSETVTVQAEAMSKSVAPIKSRFRQAFLVASPGNKSMWRVGSSGALEFSSDRGRSWLPQQTFTSSEFTAGSAPSSKVCWMVGTHGTILLTTDAGHAWKKISSPRVENLGGVRATDALHATIWDTTNSRIFETSDGGVTWKQAVNE